MRTRSRWPGSRLLLRTSRNRELLETQLLQDLARTTRPLGDEAVADVLQILDAHLAGEEAAGGQVPEAVEEGDAVRQLRPGLVRPRDVVEHLRPLGGGAGEERLVEAADALAIDPGEPAAHRDLPRRLIDHHEIHELRHAGGGGA